MECRVYLNGCPIVEKFQFKATDNKTKILKRLFKSEWEKYIDVHMWYRSHFNDKDSLLIWED